MAAMKSDGSVVTWGLSTEDPRSASSGGDIDTGSPRGGDSSAVADQLKNGVVDIFRRDMRLPLLRMMELWWWVTHCVEMPVFDGDQSEVFNRLLPPVPPAALKDNGRVVTWGILRGGTKNVDYHTFHWTLGKNGDKPEMIASVKKKLRSGVTEIFHAVRLCGA